MIVKHRLFLKSILLSAIILVLFGSCGSSSSDTVRSLPDSALKAKADPYVKNNMMVITKTDTIKIEADSLYKALYKFLEQRPSPKGLLEKLSDNTGYIAGIGDNSKKIIVLIGTALAAISYFFARKKAESSKISTSLLILSLVLFMISCVFFAWLIFTSFSLAITAVSLLLQLVGSIILIALFYWLVQIQHERVKNESANRNVLEEKMKTDVEFSVLQKEKLKLEIEQMKTKKAQIQLEEEKLKLSIAKLKLEIEGMDYGKPLGKARKVDKVSNS